jgi:hypothetical protein
MRKSLRIVALVIPMVLVASNSYAAVKAGSACTKQGVKQVSGGRSFTCIKQGKKLVWVAKDKVTVPVPVKKSQVISLEYPRIIIYSSLVEYPQSYSIAPVSSSGLPVSAMNNSPKICKLENFTITPIAVGVCQLVLNQAGNDLNLPANSIELNIEIKPECTVASRATGNGPFATATCFVGTRTISSTYLFSGSLVEKKSVYEFFGGTRIERSTFKNSMIFDYINGYWADKGPVQFSSLGWDGWKSSGCTRYSGSGNTRKCEEGSGFDVAVVTETNVGLRSYCFKQSAATSYCSWEFDINWIPMDSNYAKALS